MLKCFSILFLCININFHAQGIYEINLFVNAFLVANGLNDPYVVTNLYANYVDFYKKGVVSQNYILSDKISYFNSWPYRTNTLTSDITIVASSGDITIVYFEYYYYIKKGSKKKEGYAWTKLGLKRYGNSFLIVSEHGGLL